MKRILVECVCEREKMNRIERKKKMKREREKKMRRGGGWDENHEQ